MEILHLYTPNRGVRFYSKVEKILNRNIKNDLYKVYYKKGPFLHKLSNNSKEYDVVLITAHGAEDSIIIPRRMSELQNFSTQYRRYIEMNETDKFVNDFVFAVACSTAIEFGPKTIENGAKAYLGYEFIIENLFKVSDLQISKKVRLAYEGIAKRIFTEVLADSFLSFIDDFQTVKMLKQSFAFHLEKQLINFFKMNTDEIYKNFGYNIEKDLWKKNRSKLQVLQLEFLRDVNSHLVCLGDSEYISLIGFERNSIISKNIRTRLEKTEFENKVYSELFKSKLDRCQSA